MIVACNDGRDVPVPASHSDRRGRRRAARNLRCRHHDACGRCHRQCRQPELARRRRRRRRDPPRGGAGIACRMREVSAAARPAPPKSLAAIGCRPSTSSTPSVRCGTAAARARKNCWRPAIAPRSIWPPARLGLDRLSGDLDRRLSLPGGSRRPHRRRHGRRRTCRRAARHRAGRVLLLCASCCRSPQRGFCRSRLGLTPEHRALRSTVAMRATAKRASRHIL